MKEKIQALLEQLNMGLVEREYIIKTALLAVFAGEHPVLIGPPGTGKSMIARRIAEGLGYDMNNNEYFEYLLTKFSTPEEIFGPLSISELKADRFKRNTEGYLPTVKLAFLDEIFKASSSILNSLLTILNERKYHNGSNIENVPLQALIAASNELPNDQDELDALYDRFLVRIVVGYVSENAFPQLFENMAEPVFTVAIRIDANELENIRKAANEVTLPSEIVQAIQKIWLSYPETFKNDDREKKLSDRRLKKVIHLLKVSAATNGRSEVDLSDVFLLKDCLWSHESNAVKVKELVMSTLQGFSRAVPIDEFNDVQETHGGNVSKSVNAAESQSAQYLPVVKTGQVVKGFKGSGTRNDPLLVDSIDHLADLARTDVGQHGYHFKQIVDLDCSSVSTWPEITFKGHYDGGGHSITLKNSYLFETILQSTISGVKLSGCSLAKNAQEQCAITDCQTNKNLVNKSDNCTIRNCKVSGALIGKSAKGNNITGCESDGVLVSGCINDCVIAYSKADGKLINGDAINSKIECCQSGDFLISGTVQSCAVNDCSVVFNNSENVESAGIAPSITKKSEILRCFVMGKDMSDLWGVTFAFSGFASKCRESIIRQCALGSVQRPHNKAIYFLSKEMEGSKCENNISIDSNGVNLAKWDTTESVAAARFNQRYLEFTLGWDFDNIWMWDDKENRPALRAVGVGAAGKSGKPVAPQNPEVDLLTLQIRNNIWL